MVCPPLPPGLPDPMRGASKLQIETMDSKAVKTTVALCATGRFRFGDLRRVGVGRISKKQHDDPRLQPTVPDRYSHLKPVAKTNYIERRGYSLSLDARAPRAASGPDPLRQAMDALDRSAQRCGKGRIIAECMRVSRRRGRAPRLPARPSVPARRADHARARAPARHRGRAMAMTTDTKRCR